MAIQIRSNQIKLADTFDFSGSLGVVKVQDPSNADEAASKGYVDAQIPTPLSAGDGIDITSDTVSVDFAADGALAFTGPQSDELSVKLKAESGGSLSKDANGLYIADAAIANAKLANSTISGKALGANLDALSAGDGISMTSYDGSAAVSDLTVNLDGATLAKSGTGLKVSAGGISSTELAADSVTSAAVADGAINANSMIADAVITGPKLAVQPHRAKFTANGTDTVFAVTGKNIYSGGEDGLLVFRNGVLIEGVQSSPSGQDQYTAANNGSNLDITFGSAPTNGDVILFVGLLMS
jgi:hypothetical protein